MLNNETTLRLKLIAKLYAKEFPSELEPYPLFSFFL